MPWLAPWPHEAIAFTIVPAGYRKWCAVYPRISSGTARTENGRRGTVRGVENGESMLRIAIAQSNDGRSG